MKHTQWLVPVLVVAAEAAISAQILGGDPLTQSSTRFMTMIVNFGRVIGVCALVWAGLKVAIGRGGDCDSLVSCVAGCVLLFYPQQLVSFLFPGQAP